VPEIVFNPSTSPGINPTESGGRLINAYAEKANDGARSTILIRRAPGLYPAFQAGAGTYRGAVEVNGQLYIANGAAVYLVTKDAVTGVYTVTAQSGTLPGTGPVFMAANMAGTPDILILHSDGMSQISSSTVSDFSDPDLPSGNSLSFLDGYFFVTTLNGYSFASGINATTFASTDETRAEAYADGLLRAVASGLDQLLMGTTSIEVWSNTGNATGYPFSRSTVKKIGLWGPYAVAGYEDGFTGNVMFVASDNTVREMVGYEPQVISKPDLEALIAAETDRTAIEASVYVHRGRAVFVLSSPTWTWEYCNGEWNERQSLGKTRWRAHGGISAFDEWLVFDTVTNDVYRIDPTYKRENADQLVWEVRSIQAHRFPGRVYVERADFDMMTGVGIANGIDPIETDPKVQISWSIDGGKTFGNPLFRTLGPEGRKVPITVRPRQTTKELGIQFRLVVADPVDVVLFGGADEIAQLAA
jgi:hypothetical protein